MTKFPTSASLDSAVEYERRHLVATTENTSYCTKWLIVVSVLTVGAALVSIGANWNYSNNDGLGILWRKLWNNEEIPLLEADTTFHLTSIQDSKGRWKRASIVAGVITEDEATTTSEASSGSGFTTTAETASQNDETTAFVTASGEGSGSETTTAAGGETTTGGGGETTTGGGGETTTGGGGETTTGGGGETTTGGGGETTTEDLGSGEATTAVTKDSIEPTTDSSMFESSGSGDFTTTASAAPTDLTTAATDLTTATAPLEFSGDETTADIEASGSTTADTTTTGSMFEASGTTDTTEVEERTTTSLKQETTSPVILPESTTVFLIGGSTAAPPEETTDFEVTTAGGGAAADDGLMVPFWVAIIVGVVGIILGVVLVFAVMAFMKWLRKKKLVTPIPTPGGSSAMLKGEDMTRPPELNWLMAREDTLLKAMALGQISVLDFALVESRAAGLMDENPMLMKEAETKLNQWKRTRTQLENSYRERDLANMDEFMTRFNESGMKDDAGAYQKCVDLKWNMKHAELNMENAADARDESMLMTATGQFEALKLQTATMGANPPYLHARQVMEEIRQEKLLQGRSWDVFRMDLRAAVLAREPSSISVAIDKFMKAEVPDVYDDIPNANRALEMIEAERKDNLEVSQKKMEEASFARDQDALRNSIEECKRFGATEEALKGPEKLLRIVGREDILLAELGTLTAEGDMAKLSNAIVVFKTPTVEMVDKTGDLAKAEEVLEKLQQKEKLRKTKDDVMWRLQNAMAIGDVTAMDGMIKALHGLAAAGETIDEAFLIRAMGELEACRGQVDYRKRMEAIKSALARTMALENIPQTEDLVDQMSMLAEDKEYTMTADDTRVLDDARTTLNSIKNKKAVIDELALVRPELVLPLIPPNLPRLKDAVDRMSVAKKDAEPFDGVFTQGDSTMLEDAKVNAKVLEHKVTVMTEARERLDLAVDKRDYTDLKHAIRNAIEAPFVERKELIEPRKLAVFLDPKARRMAVKKGMRSRDIRMLEIALQDFKDAKVEDETLLLKGERTLDKLRKRERREEKEERRKERADGKRAADIARLTQVLQQAIASRDTEHIQLALEEFEESGYDEEDVPVVSEAEELFDTLKIQDLRERLLDSIKRRDLNGLENAIDDADYGGYVMDVKEEYDIAKDLLYHLRELNKLREAISDMNRSLISEIHKYPTPPRPVHQVMAAAFILLGESPKKLKNWIELQALLGKLGVNSITRKVRVCVPGDIPSPAIKRAEQQLSGLKLEEVAEISKGAATFFAWSTCMIKEHAQVSNEQRALADIGLPDIGIPDRPVTRGGDFAWVEENA